jgi:hypothetical protein
MNKKRDYVTMWIFAIHCEIDKSLSEITVPPNYRFDVLAVIACSDGKRRRASIVLRIAVASPIA